jgi:hypothetical protein
LAARFPLSCEKPARLKIDSIEQMTLFPTIEIARGVYAAGLSRGMDAGSLSAADVDGSLHSSVIGASDVRNLVPMLMPCAPNISAAASPRPSAMPPGDHWMEPAMSTTWGTGARADTKPPKPPASREL